MAQLVGPLRKELADSLSSCRVLVVGAGGIGCELLKNLVLAGFKNIEVIDLDTIDVSNLNRQFLFQKKHVGKSKAQVAKESVLRFCPSASITAYHDSIMNPDYNVEFFRNFQLVMNALDNRESSKEEACGTGLKDQQVLNVQGYAQLFHRSVETLRSQLMDKGDGAELVWDKDDPPAMDFVTAAANLRMNVFSMNMKSRFDVKSMAGNIIPAIATTNAVIAGLIVLEALKILNSDFDQCRTIFLNKQPNPRKKLLVPCALDPPNPNCYVCASKPEVTVKLNVHKTIVQALQDRILKEKFGMVAPDVQIEDGKGTILISSEEGETEANNNKFLSDFGIRNGSRLQADDFLQDYTLLVNVIHSEELEKDVEFEVVGDAPDKAPAPSAPEEGKNIANGNKDSAQPSTSSKAAAEDDDVLIVDSDEEPSSSTMEASPEPSNRKRKHHDAETDDAASKRKRLDQQPADDDEDIIALD
ncbi:SUMO-activating enzyme subunit 2 [Labeo rohita]|uniref:SUMO-activating enzyme subunit 2 n=1 Tax=Labeo rohita TaxID=84645 RepID=A0A498M1Y0_LABRO|nr:SUMO-activating enzyme subunit 2 [Labeo rohita]